MTYRFVVVILVNTLIDITLQHLYLVSDWDREKLLEAWMYNEEECCQRSGVQKPNPPPSGYNAWDTLPSPRTPRTACSSLTSPDQISLMPAGDESSLVRDRFFRQLIQMIQLEPA